ncbi:hypothetical protein Tco_0530511 [Tanacetum coccineum]
MTANRISSDPDRTWVDEILRFIRPVGYGPTRLLLRYSDHSLKLAAWCTNSSTPAVSSDVAELKDMVRALILDKKNQTPAPAPVKAVEQSCVTCGGGHSLPKLSSHRGNIYRDNIQNNVSQAAAQLTTTKGMPVTDLRWLQTKFDLLARDVIGRFSVEQMTLRHDDQSVTFKVGDTKTFSYNIIEMVNRVDVIDIACEEYVQEVLGNFE